jgi:hypothetical protein
MCAHTRGREAFLVGQPSKREPQRNPAPFEVDELLARKICRDLGVPEP